MTQVFATDDLHRNLRKKCVSIRQRGRIVAHPTTIVANDIELRVQPGGLASVRGAGVRAVCDYARAAQITVVDALPADLLARGVRVHFNPFQQDSFVLEDGTPVDAAAGFLMISRIGSWVIDPVTTREKN